MRNSIPPCFLVMLASFMSVIAGCNNNTAEKKFEPASLLTRKEALSYASEWAAIQNNADVLRRNIQKNPEDKKSLLLLTALYLQEARNSGNFEYYNTAALTCIDKVLMLDSKNFEARSFRATILLSQHRFEQGLVEAEQLVKEFPYNAYVYGLLIDGLVESGKYAEAVVSAEKMVSIRPDARSYARIAYLREIHGDLEGALHAMKLAVDAGAPGDENTEWCRVQMGNLFCQLGKYDEAAQHYQYALINRPNYPFALGGLAALATARKEYAKAMTLYKHADSLVSDHHFKEGIAELYSLTGQQQKAIESAEEILHHMKSFESNSKKDIGQNEDHEIAHAYMGVANLEKALEYAIKEQERRPGNIEVNETVALVYYKMGEYQKALPFMETALSTGSNNPELLCNAGLLYLHTGDIQKGTALIQKALRNNPVITAELKSECNDLSIRKQKEK